MPATTPRNAYPYPVAADPADVPKDIKALADRLDLLSPASAAALPGSPVDGEEVTIVADPATGIAWRFKYRAASTSTSKWEFVGGSAIAKGQDAQQGPIAWTAGNVNTWVDSPTVTGPQVIVPLAGDYMVEHSAAIVHLVGGAMVGAGVSLLTVIAGKVPTWAVDRTGNFWLPHATAPQPVTDVPANGILRQQYTSDTAGNMYVQRRHIAVTPIRVG
jgi:hypothetical protein